MARFQKKIKYVALKAKRGARRNSLDFAKDLWLTVTVFFGSVGALVALGVVVVLTVTHSADNAEGVVHDWAKNYPNNAIIGFASAHLLRLIGVLAFVPVFMLIPRRSFPVLVMSSTVLVVSLLPEAHFYQYLAMSTLLHFFLHARLPSTRAIVVIAFALYVVFFHGMLSGVAHPSKHFEALMKSAMHRSPSSVRVNSGI